MLSTKRRASKILTANEPERTKMKKLNNETNANKRERLGKMMDEAQQRQCESGAVFSMKAPTNFDKAQILYAFLTMQEGNFTEVNLFGDKTEFVHPVLGPIPETETFTRETAPDFKTFYEHYEACTGQVAQCVWESSNGGRVSMTSFKSLDFVAINIIGDEIKRIDAEFDEAFNDAFGRMTEE